MKNFISAAVLISAFFSTHQSEASGPPIKKMVREFVQAIEAGDSARVFSYYHPDIQYEDVLWGVKADGLALLKKALETAFDEDGLVPDLEILDVLVSKANQSFTMVGRFRNNDQEPWVEYMSWFRLKDGKIVGHSDYVGYTAQSLMEYSPRFKKKEFD